MEEPHSSLALVLLLDQFPRNVFRGSPESYSSDAKALRVSTYALAKGFDRRVPLLRQQFFYLPFMHDETLQSQVAGKALYESCAHRCGGDVETRTCIEDAGKWGQSHLDVILRFGRSPSRNEVLGRRSTDEEIEFLKKHPGGF